jgi:hypothetical protein
MGERLPYEDQLLQGRSLGLSVRTTPRVRVGGHMEYDESRTRSSLSGPAARPIPREPLTNAECFDRPCQGSVSPDSQSTATAATNGRALSDDQATGRVRYPVLCCSRAPACPAMRVTTRGLEGLRALNIQMCPTNRLAPHAERNLQTSWTGASSCSWLRAL